MPRGLPLRTRLFLRRCRLPVAVMSAWVALGAVGFHLWHGVGLGDSLQNALYLGGLRGPFWDIYSWWGQCVLFGIVVSVFLLQAFQTYNPQEACRMVAREMKGHAIVVGCTHLGRRVVERLRQQQRPYVLVEKDPSVVDDLLRAGEPVVVDDAREESTLIAAGIDRAILVIVLSDNIETALLVTKRTRQRNRTARIIVRCFHDDFAEILEGLGADQIVSSSKSAFLEVEPHLVPGTRRK